MASSDKDTDPSTPQSIRASDPSVPVAASASSTDPGLGPARAAPISSRPPRGVVVPPPTVRAAPVPGDLAPDAPPLRAAGPRPGGKKDSVELLLEGMEEPKADRTKTTPQSHGEAAAAYHAEHLLRPGGVHREDEPKVLVERGFLRSNGGGAMVTTEPVGRHLRTQTRRIVAAIVAGLLVVLALFGVMRATAGTSGSAPSIAVTERSSPPVPPLPPTSPATGVAPAPPVPDVPSVTVAAAEVGATPPSQRPSEPARAAASSPHRAPVRTAPGASASALGEFKTTF